MTQTATRGRDLDGVRRNPTLDDLAMFHKPSHTLPAVIHAGANYIWHSAGWNEAGMH